MAKRITFNTSNPVSHKEIMAERKRLGRLIARANLYKQTHTKAFLENALETMSHDPIYLAIEAGEYNATFDLVSSLREVRSKGAS